MEAGRGESEESSVIVEKTTEDAGRVTYWIDGGRKHPNAHVRLEVTRATVTLVIENAPQIVTYQDGEIDLLRQALQFIDGETHKHRTAQETA